MAATGLMSQPSLPDEMLNMVCHELGQDRDFGSLFRCALASRSLADPALRTLYQYCLSAPQLATLLMETGIMKSRLSFSRATNSILV